MEKIKSKVAIIKCLSYNLDEVYNSIKKGIDLIGGIREFIKPDEKILLKPNLLAGREPEKCVTTHPSIFEAIIKILLQENVSISYGDSPGFDSPNVAYKKSGFMQIANKYKIMQADFDKGKNIRFENGNFTKEFNIVNGVFDNNGIISLPKMKSHQLTRITGAIKNQFGCITGFNKAAFHVKIPNATNFCKMLVDLNLFLKPRLYIMDGIYAMEGNGPASGDPVKMNVLIISNDPVAVDATFCRLVFINPEYIPTNIYGYEYGLGTYKENEIEYLGDDITQFINKNFNIIRRPIRNMAVLPFMRKFQNLVIPKPVINKKLCKKCGICIESCPAPGKAIKFVKRKENIPVFDYNKCIRCYCCQEVCPYKSIYVYRSLLCKIFGD